MASYILHSFRPRKFFQFRFITSWQVKFIEKQLLLLIKSLQVISSNPNSPTRDCRKVKLEEEKKPSSFEIDSVVSFNHGV